jgi:hypothetical protein
VTAPCDVKVVLVEPDGSCPPRDKGGCGDPKCARVLLEWWKGPHDGLCAFACRKQVVLRDRVQVIGHTRRCYCDRLGCRRVRLRSLDGPLLGRVEAVCEAVVQARLAGA